MPKDTSDILSALDSCVNADEDKPKKKDQVVDYILDLFIDKNNPLKIAIAFADRDEVLGFFGLTDTYNLGSLFEGRGTKKDLKRFQSDLKKLSLNIYLVGPILFDEFNGKAITSSDAKLLGVLFGCRVRFADSLDPNILPVQYFFNMLPDIKFEHIKGQHEHTFRDSNKPKNISQADYLFIKEVINCLVEDYDVSDFLAMRNDPQFHKIAFAVYNRAFEIGCYKFNESDINVFKSCNLSLTTIPPFFTVGSSYNDNSESITLCFNQIVDELIKKYHDKELSLVELKKFISNNQNYTNVLKEFPALVELEPFLACASLEKISRPRGVFTGYNLEKKEVEVKPAIEYLSHFNKTDRNSIVLTCACDQVSTNKDVSALIELLSLFSFEEATESEKLLYKDVKALLFIMANKEFSKEDMGEIAYSFLLSLRGLNTLPLFKFIEVESDNWWDYGSKEVPNSLQFLPNDCLKEHAASDSYRLYSELVSSCYDKGFYQLIASETSYICGLSHMIWELEPLHSKVLDSLNKLSEDELSLLSKRDKLAAFYLATLKDKKLARRLLQVIGTEDKQWKGDSLNTKEMTHSNLEVISSDLDMFAKCLSQYGNEDFFDIYNVFAQVIGRQQRGALDRTVIMSRCISNAINHNVIGFEKSNIAIEIKADSERDRHSYRREQYSQREFIRNHFPRLKASWAFTQIHMIYSYFKSINLHQQAIENITEEGIFHHEDKIYVFGEFKWDDVFIDPVLSGEITKIVILTSSIDYSENENDESENHASITTIELTLNKFAIATVLSCFEALTIDTFAVDEILSGRLQQSDFQRVYSRKLPLIEHEGITLNN